MFSIHGGSDKSNGKRSEKKKAGFFSSPVSEKK
jgi:hypothetical protein